jgi:signal peptidase I
MSGRAAARATAVECTFLFFAFAWAAYALRAWVFEVRFIPSVSMRPALEVGDRLLVEKMTPVWRTPPRGTVVVFFPPGSGATQRAALVKRVIALPGERITVRGVQVWIGGRRLPEDYLSPLMTTQIRRNRGVPDIECVVPGDSIYVMGDNRPDSTDSRHFGPVAMRDVIGRAVLGFWPLERWRWLLPRRR